MHCANAEGGGRECLKHGSLHKIMPNKALTCQTCSMVFLRNLRGVVRKVFRNGLDKL